MMMIMQKPVHSSSTSAFDTHATVRALRARSRQGPERLTVGRIRAIALEAGADDAGIVSLEHPDLVEEVPHARCALPSPPVGVTR